MSATHCPSVPPSVHSTRRYASRLELLEHSHSAALALWLLTLSASFFLTGIHWVSPSSLEWPQTQAKALWISTFIGAWCITRRWRELSAGSRRLMPEHWHQTWRMAWWQWQAALMALNALLISVVCLKHSPLVAQAGTVALVALGSHIAGTALAWAERSANWRALKLSALPGRDWWTSLRLVDFGRSRQGQAPSLGAVLSFTLLVPSFFGGLAQISVMLSGLTHSVALLCAARVIVCPNHQRQASLWPSRVAAKRALHNTLLHTLALWCLIDCIWKLGLGVLIWQTGMRPVQAIDANSVLMAQLEFFLAVLAGLTLILWLMARLPNKPLWRDAVMCLPAVLSLAWWGWSHYTGSALTTGQLDIHAAWMIPVSALLLWDTYRHWPATQQHATPLIQP